MRQSLRWSTVCWWCVALNPTATNFACIKVPVQNIPPSFHLDYTPPSTGSQSPSQWRTTRGRPSPPSMSESLLWAVFQFTRFVHLCFWDQSSYLNMYSPYLLPNFVYLFMFFKTNCLFNQIVFHSLFFYKILWGLLLMSIESEILHMTSYNPELALLYSSVCEIHSQVMTLF